MAHLQQSRERLVPSLDVYFQHIVDLVLDFLEVLFSSIVRYSAARTQERRASQVMRIRWWAAWTIQTLWARTTRAVIGRVLVFSTSFFGRRCTLHYKGGNFQPGAEPPRGEGGMIESSKNGAQTFFP